MRLLLCSLGFSIKVFFHNNSVQSSKYRWGFIVANMKQNQGKNYKILFLGTSKVLKNTFYLDLEEKHTEKHKIFCYWLKKERY